MATNVDRIDRRLAYYRAASKDSRRPPAQRAAARRTVLDNVQDMIRKGRHR